MHLSKKMPTRVGVLVVCAFFASVAAAQNKKEPEAKPRNTLIGPVSVGFRVGILVGDLMNVSNSSETDTDVNPPRTTEITADTTSSHAGWGPVAQINFTRHIMLDAELLHRGVGYGVTTSLIDEATDTSNAALVSETVETTTAKFWDLMLLPRYQFGNPGKPRAYVTGGFALRSLSKERASLQTTDADGNVETSDATVQVAHTAIHGAVVGVGVQAQDDVGFKVELGFRYTRWFQPTFDITGAGSRRNQAEVLVGLTF